jgi:hypothetical protein
MPTATQRPAAITAASVRKRRECDDRRPTQTALQLSLVTGLPFGWLAARARRIRRSALVDHCCIPGIPRTRLRRTVIRREEALQGRAPRAITVEQQQRLLRDPRRASTPASASRSSSPRRRGREDVGAKGCRRRPCRGGRLGAYACAPELQTRDRTRDGPIPIELFLWHKNLALPGLSYIRSTKFTRSCRWSSALAIGVVDV